MTPMTHPLADVFLLGFMLTGTLSDYKESESETSARLIEHVPIPPVPVP